jgi:hypothetical protein
VSTTTSHKHTTTREPGRFLLGMLGLNKGKNSSLLKIFCHRRPPQPHHHAPSLIFWYFLKRFFRKLPQQRCCALLPYHRRNHEKTSAKSKISEYQIYSNVYLSRQPAHRIGYSIILCMYDAVSYVCTRGEDRYVLPVNTYR